MFVMERANIKMSGMTGQKKKTGAVYAFALLR